MNGSTAMTVTLPLGCPGRESDPVGAASAPELYDRCAWMLGVPVTPEDGEPYFETAHGVCCSRCFATGGSVVWPKHYIDRTAP